MKIVNKNWKSFLINILKSMPQFTISWDNKLSADFSWKGYFGFSTNVSGVILVKHNGEIFRFNLNKNKDRKRFIDFTKAK